MNYCLNRVRLRFIGVIILFSVPTVLIAQRSIQARISGSDTSFSFKVGGNLDAVNTRKYQHESIFRFNQLGVENNVSFSLENKGVTDIINPIIGINGKQMVYTMKDLINRIPLNNLKTIDDTVMSIQSFLWDNYYHWLVSTEIETYRTKPLKTFNVFGAGQCENSAQLICSMLKFMGYENVFPAGLNYYHTVGLLQVNGRSIILDADLKTMYTRRDNKTLADLGSVIWDRELASRQHHGGFQVSELVSDDDVALGYTDLKRTGYTSYYNWTNDDTMSLRIRPFEQIIFNYDSSLGNSFSYYHSVRDSNPDRPIPPSSSLGIVKYAPKLSSAWLNSINYSENVKSNDSTLYCVDADKIASLIVDFKNPYVWTNGKIILSFSKSSEGSLKVSGRKDYQNEYTALYETAYMYSGSKTDTIDLFNFIRANSYPTSGEPMTNLYYVKFEWSSKSFKGITIDSLKFENNFQLNPNALPRLKPGDNTISVSNRSGEPFKDLVYTHNWKEIDESLIPAPPGGPLYPQNGQVVNSSQFEFAWDGTSSEAISDFNIQVSEYPDFRFPVSSTFNKLTSQQHNGELARWKIPHLGLLNPSTVYYWRVATRSTDGVWSPWSNVWSFTIDAVGVPLNPSYENAGDSIILKWDSNPQGTKPSKFYVLASDERGFSYSDSLIIDSTENNFYTIKNASKILNYAFYRVVALGMDNSKSGISDLISIEDRLLYNSVPILIHDSINLKLVKVEPRDFYGRSGPPDYAPHLVVDSLVFTSVVLPSGLVLEDNSLKGKFEKYGDTVIEISGRTWQSDKIVLEKISFDVDLSPEIIGLTKSVVKSDSNFYAQIIVNNRDGDSIIYSSDNLPKWLVLDSLSGTLSGTPSSEDAGDHIITLTAKDNNGGINQSSLKIRVWATSPYFTIKSVSDSILKVEEKAVIETTTIVDPGYTNRIKYQLRRGPDWLNVNPKNGKISGTPPLKDYGKEYLVHIRAFDTNRLYSDYIFSVHVTRANTAPRFLTIPNTVCFSDTPYRYQVKALDDDVLFRDSVARYLLLKSPTWLTIDSGGLVSGIVSENSNKKYKIVIGAVDVFGDTTLQIYTLRVLKEVPDTPIQAKPKEFVLYQNYPNPFSLSTTISFDLPEQSQVQIEVVNLVGQRQVILADNIFDDGHQNIKWNAAGIPDGVYFVIARISTLSGQKKMRFIKKVVAVK